MELLQQGAEAKLFRSEYLGRPCVVKQRQPKNYREKILDERILRERIRTECMLLSRAKKAGVRTPVVWKVDLGAKEITCEFVDGKTMKKELLRGSANSLEYCKKAGEIVARLHSCGIIHGDLTTSNIIIHNDGLVLLDFGLGRLAEKQEEFAVDLLVFKKTFAATHYRLEGGWDAVENAYIKAFSTGKSVVAHIGKIEARARYY
ncbi:MAG: KEOPS complex kinase/ATPase Bud32 [archaeon]|nr:KEOPS complex kinase/ATPase Bud32 [archaeon]